jgi:hypothetical protein
MRCPRVNGKSDCAWRAGSREGRHLQALPQPLANVCKRDLQIPKIGYQTRDINSGPAASGRPYQLPLLSTSTPSTVYASLDPPAKVRPHCTPLTYMGGGGRRGTRREAPQPPAAGAGVPLQKAHRKSHPTSNRGRAPKARHNWGGDPLHATTHEAGGPPPLQHGGRAHRTPHPKQQGEGPHTPHTP